MQVRDDLGKRMKEFYEQVPKTRLVRRMPVCIRLDGKAFHTFTRGFQKPFDDILIESMQETMKYLCENIQGCVLGYTQSDEITLILVDYKKLTSSAWFDYEVQKMCSIAASMATMTFNKIFEQKSNEWGEENFPYWELGGTNEKVDESLLKLCSTYNNAIDKGAMFDARVFNIPKEEVCNLVYWRQLDATRNSIQMLGQSEFSHKELQNKSCNDIQDMLMTQRGINWNDLETVKKRGSCCIKCDGVETTYAMNNGVKVASFEHQVERPHWIIDKEIPIFSQNRAYIEDLIEFE